MRWTHPGTDPAFQLLNHTSSVFGDSASRTASRGFVSGVIAAAVKECKPLGLIFDVSLAEYESLFRRAVQHRQLERLRLGPHCARHGGPSTDAMLGIHSLSEIQRRGRWDALVSVRRYETHGTLTRQVAAIPAAKLQEAKRCLKLLQTILRS